MAKIDRYLHALNTSAAYDMDAKVAFHNAARTLLRRLAKELGDEYGEHDPIRSNKGGIAVSGEVTLHYDHLYVQVSQFSFGDGRGVMFRGCDSRSDYTGHANHYATFEQLADTKLMAAIIRNCVKRRSK